MRHFKTDSGIRAIDTDQEGLIQETWVEILDADLAAEIELAKPPLTAKEARDRDLNLLTHDFGDGRIMQTRPADESNIRNAIEVATANSLPGINWRMADNTVAAVTVAELQSALAASQLAALQIWDTYNAAV